MKVKLRMSALLLCVLMGLGSLAGCVGEAEEPGIGQAERDLIVPMETNPLPAAEELRFKYVISADSAEEAMRRMEVLVASKDAGYQYKVRDFFYCAGKRTCSGCTP